MRFRKIAAALLTLTLGFCLCQPAAFAATAADQHTQLQELPVSIQSTGETPLLYESAADGIIHARRMVRASVNSVEQVDSAST